MYSEKAMAPHSSTLAWRIPGTGEPRKLLEEGRVWVFGEGDGTPLQYSCLENPMDGGAWWAAVRGVSKSDKTE